MIGSNDVAPLHDPEAMCTLCSEEAAQKKRQCRVCCPDLIFAPIGLRSASRACRQSPAPLSPYPYNLVCLQDMDLYANQVFAMLQIPDAEPSDGTARFISTYAPLFPLGVCVFPLFVCGVSPCLGLSPPFCLLLVPHPRLCAVSALLSSAPSPPPRSPYTHQQEMGDGVQTLL
jgi:hypothetical protein